jgi:CRISPR-associated protein Cas2
LLCRRHRSDKLVNKAKRLLQPYYFHMTNRQLYLAAYDISCNRRLRKALYVLRSFSSGGQKSVFECFLTPAEKAQLLDEIGRVIDPDEDRFILLRLAGAKHIRTLGKAVLPQDGSFFYVG